MQQVFSQSRRLLFLFVLFLLPSCAMLAQTNYGDLRGEVKDIQGAVIASAQITLTNEATKFSRTAVTNNAGIYQFPGIDPGTYKVTISLSGFKNFETTGNVVSLGAVTTVDAVMQIGGSNETVEVAAESVTLNTANATAEQVFTAQQIEDLPNLGRDPFMFAQLDANVVTLGDPRYVRAEDSSGVSDVSLAGAPGNTNSYVVDGIPVSTSSGGATFVVSPEAVAEAKIQADTFDAQIGRTGGGVFNNTIKSGSSQYHGVLYGETRQTAWSANVWFNPTSTAKPTDETYLYSGAFGGPLVPPVLKDKAPKWLDNTFYWLTEEGYRQGQPTTGTSTYYVPTAAERTGDFTIDPALYDPAVAGSTPITGTASARTVTFASECNGFNVIPGSPAATKYGTTCGGLNYFNGVGFAIANDFNQPTNSNTFVTKNAPNFNVGGIGFKTRADEYIGKLEHQFFPWWTAQISYLHSAVQEPQTTPANAGNIYTSGAEKEDRKFDSTALNNTFTLSPSMLLTVGWGYNRYWSSFPYYSQGFNLASGFAYNGGNYGFANSYTSNVPISSFPSVTLSGLSNGYSAPTLGGSWGGVTPQASHNLVVVLAKTIRKHDLRFGYTYRGFSYFTSPPNTSGSFTFNGQYTDATGTAASATASQSTIADLEIGLPSALSETLYAGPFLNRISYNSVFAQDDFRLTEKLTFNAGLRYEYELGQHEVHNKFNVGFSPTEPISYVNASSVTQNLTGGLVFAGVSGAPTHCCDNGNLKFSPRIGVAYQVAKDTVMHAGYGFFFAPIGITTSYNQGYSQITSPTIQAPGASSSNSPIGTVAASQIGSGACLSSPFFGGTCPGGLLQPSANTLGGLTGLGGALTAFDSKRQYPLVQQYMLDLQQKMPGDVVVTVSYIGTHSTNFPEAVNINQIPDSVLTSSYASGTSLSSTGTNPYYATTIGGLPTTGVVASKTLALGQTYMPFPYFGSISLTKSIGYGWYNSLALKAEKRMAAGLTLLVTFTHASNWDNLYGSVIGSQTTTTSGPQDNYNLGAEYARSLDSVPNRFTTAITDQLPFGKGKKFLGHPSGFIGHTIDAVAGGWQVNYEQVISNGVPLTVTQTDMNTQFGPTGTGGAVQRPTLVGDVHGACLHGKPQGRLGAFGGAITEAYYVNSGAFAPTQPYHYGNAPRTLPCRTPGYDTATASLNKNLFKFHDRYTVQFRIEALNLWNTPQFATPSTTYTVTPGSSVTAAAAVSSSNTLGSLSAQAGFARIIQMGGRISF